MPDGVEPPHLFCDTQTVLERFGNQLWAPEFSAGDVMVFTHFVLHRTHIVPGMTRQRQMPTFESFPVIQFRTMCRKTPGGSLSCPVLSGT